MTDKEIIEFFSNKRGKIDPNKTRQSYLDKYPEIKDYLFKRYDVFFSYTQTLKYIFAGITELPKCKTCGSILTNVNATYCSSVCQLKDPEFQKYAQSKIDYQARTEKFKATCLEKFGVEVPAKNPEILAKMTQNHDYKKGSQTYKQTIRNRYGVDSTLQIPEVRDKAMATKRKNRPTDPNNSAKAMETMRLKYGKAGTLAVPELRQKVKATNLLKYGDENFTNRTKHKQTVISKYGEDLTLYGSEGFKQNMLNKYGVENFSQSKEYLINKKRKFYLDGIGFDSFFEVVFYLYHKDLGHTIKHEPCQFVYYYNNRKHVYNPDFRVDGQLYEIKGAHFFENGVLINPFDRSLDGLYKAKHDCMKKHSVKIVTDISKYLNYCRERNLIT